MKLFLTALTFLTVSIISAQDLTGKWANASFSGEENFAYVFSIEGTMEMFYAGEKVETEKPVTYTLTQKGDFHHLEFSYKRKNGSFSANVLGLIKFTGKNVMEFETFDKNNLPKELDFTEESMMFRRE